MSRPLTPPARRVLLILFGLWLVQSWGPVVAAPEPAVKLEAVKYSDLVRAVKAHHGKVVVVDFWAEY
jgi:hypothetical protein